MKMKQLFSHRPFFIICLTATALFSAQVFAADTFNRSGQYAVAQSDTQDTPVRYGSGGFAPTNLSSSSDKDDMTGGVVATPLPATGDSYQANLEVRLSNLENQMRDMRGQLEQKDHDIAQLKTQLDKALADIDMRLGQGAAPGWNDTASR